MTWQSSRIFPGLDALPELPDHGTLDARREGGRKANKAGRDHEASLEALHDLYRATGRAYIRRRPHECIRVGGEPAMWVPKGPTGADFGGWVMDGTVPRPIVVEAKSIAESGKRTLTLTGVGGWSEAERADLADAADCRGAFSLVVVDVKRGTYAGRWTLWLHGESADELRAGAIKSLPLIEGDVRHPGVYGPNADYLDCLNLKAVGL